MRWPWQRRAAPGAAQQRPRVVPPRRDWMGLAPLQRTVPSPTLTTATDGFSSRLASRSARPLVQPLTHGVMPDAPTGHLDGVTRPSPPASPRVDPQAQSDLPLAGDRVVAQRATAVRRTALTSAPAASTPGRRVRAVPPVQRQVAQPAADTPVADTPLPPPAGSAPQAGGNGTAPPAGDADLPLVVDPAGGVHEPASEPADVPSGDPVEPPSTPVDVASLVEASGGTVDAEAPTLAGPAGRDAASTPAKGTTHVARAPADAGGGRTSADREPPLPEARPATRAGAPSPLTPAGGAAPAGPGRSPVQRATSADGRARPPRQVGLGEPLVSPVQRSASAGNEGTDPGPPAPASPPGMPLRASPATAAAAADARLAAATPAADAARHDGGGVRPDVTDGGAGSGAGESDAPTIGERTPPTILGRVRSDGSEVAAHADEGPPPVAQRATPGAPDPDGAPVDLPLQRATGPSAASTRPSAASTSGTTGQAVTGVHRAAEPGGPGGPERGGGRQADVDSTGTGTQGSALPLQRSRATGSAGDRPTATSASTAGAAPAVPGHAAAPAATDAPSQADVAHVAVASPQLRPPLVPLPLPAPVSVPLLAQRPPLLQRDADADADAGSQPSPGVGGPPAGGVTRATQMSTTVPSRRAGQGPGSHRTAPAGLTVQPLRRVGARDGDKASAAPRSSGARPSAPPPPGARQHVGGGEVSVSAMPLGDAAATTHGAGLLSGGPTRAGQVVQTLTPAPSGRRGPVTTAVVAGVQRLIARGSRSAADQRQGAATGGAQAATMTGMRDRVGGDAAVGVDGGATVAVSRPTAALSRQALPDAPADSGEVDLAMPQVPLRPAPGGTAAMHTARTQATAPPATETVMAPAPVVQRAPEPVAVAEPPPPAVAVAAGVAAASGGPPQSEEDLDVLAGRLYEHIAGRLRHELRVDRERTGLLTDLQG